jgi:hypothetical protein
VSDRGIKSRGAGLLSFNLTWLYIYVRTEHGLGTGTCIQDSKGTELVRQIKGFCDVGNSYSSNVVMQSGRHSDPCLIEDWI